MIINSVLKGGSGDVVNAFGVGKASAAVKDDKVTLNYSATMLPYEITVTDSSFKTPTSNTGYSYNFTYCDRNRILMTAAIDTNYPLPVLLTRQEDGSFKYAKVLDTSSNIISPFADFQPFAMARLNGNAVYRLDKNNNLSNVGTTNYLPGSITYREDYKIACSGGSKPILLRNTGTYWEPITTSNLDINIKDAYTGYGLIGDKLIVLNRDKAYTYSYDEAGVTTLVGSSSLQSSGNYIFNFWCWFDNGTKLITSLGYNSSDNPPFGLTVWDVSVDESGIYGFVINESLQNQVLNCTAGQVGFVKNITRVDDKIYIWNEQALVVLQWNGTSFTQVERPFADYDYNGSFFINPIDKMAIMQVDGTSCVVRYLDALASQSYIATETEGGLFFPTTSLTGFTSKNNGGILDVQTILDPNATVPSYPDTYGLETTVNPGAANTDVVVPYGTGTNLNNANGATFFGFMPKSAVTFDKIYLTGRSDGGSASSTAKYLKLFIWDEVQQLYTFVACSTNTQTVPAGGQGEWEFETTQNLTANTYYGFAFSTDNTAAWSGLTGCGFRTQGAEAWLDNKLKCTTQTSNPPTSFLGFIPVFSFLYHGVKEGNVDISYGYYKSGDEYVKWKGVPPATLADVEGTKSTEMKLYLAQNGTQTVSVLTQTTPTLPKSHLVKDPVYLSDTLDYFMPNPYGLEPDIAYGYDIMPVEKPTLTANGTLGGDSFAVAATDQYSSTYAAWKCFTETNTDCWVSNASASTSNPIYYTIYNPEPVQINFIEMRNRSSSATEMLGDFVFQASNDGVTWEDIATFNNRNTTANASALFEIPEVRRYNYHRFKITSNASGVSGRVSIGHFSMFEMHAESDTPTGIVFVGAVSVSEGWQELGGVQYSMPKSVMKLKSLAIEGQAATTMYLWMMRSSNTVVSDVFANSLGIATILTGRQFATFLSREAGVQPHNTLQEFGQVPWEINTKIITGELGIDQAVFGPTYGYESEVATSPMIKITTDNKFQVYLSSDGQNWDISAPAAAKYGSVSANTAYWLKLGWTGSQYYFSYSTDGTEYTQLYTKDSTTPVWEYSYFPMIGNNMAAAVDKYFRGTVDLRETNYKENDQIVWSAYTVTPGNSTDFVVSVDAPANVDYSYKYLTVYLSNALDRFVEELEPEPDHEEEILTDNSDAVKMTYTVKEGGGCYLGVNPAGMHCYIFPFSKLPTSPYISEFPGVLPVVDSSFSWAKSSSARGYFGVYKDLGEGNTSSYAYGYGRYEMVGNRKSLRSTGPFVNYAENATSILSMQGLGFMITSYTKIPTGSRIILYRRDCPEVTDAAKIRQNSSSQFYILENSVVKIIYTPCDVLS